MMEHGQLSEAIADHLPALDPNEDGYLASGVCVADFVGGSAEYNQRSEARLKCDLRRCTIRRS